MFPPLLSNVVFQAVGLHFTRLSTESCCDKVRVYDGNDTTAPLLHTFSGTSRPIDCRTTGNTAFVSFSTDGSVLGSASVSCIRRLLLVKHNVFVNLLI